MVIILFYKIGLGGETMDDKFFFSNLITVQEICNFVLQITKHIQKNYLFNIGKKIKKNYLQI